MRLLSGRASLATLARWGRSVGTGTKIFVKSFICSRRGNIAISFALAIIPLIIATGTAIDLSRALIVHNRLSAALDAAGLAVGRAVNLTEQESKNLAQAFFNANYPASALGVPGPVTVTISGDTVTLSTVATVPTTFMQIAGFDKLDVAATSTVTREATGLELALVLDTTGSMSSNNKMGTLKTAATDLVNTLFGSSVYPENLKIGIVPFAEAVRLDTTTLDLNWIDTTGTSSAAQKNFSGGKYAYWLYTNAGGMSNTPWLGCVEARPSGLEEADTVPSAGNPNTRWVPMFQPDEPHVGEGENNSWNPAGPNQSSISSNYNNDYITNQITVSTKQISFSTQTFSPMTFTVQSTSTSTLAVNSHGFSTGDGPIKVGTTGTLPSGLNSSTNYWVINVNSGQIKLATSRSNALSGVALPITGKGSGTFLLNTVISSNHLFASGDGPIHVRSSSSLPSGLSSGTNYWVVATTDARFQLATNKANATAATPATINLTSAGSGTDMTNALSSPDHLLVTGDGPVTLTGTVPGGLSTSTNYYVTKVNDDLFQLATSASNATANPPVVIDPTSTSTNGKVVVPGIDTNAETLYAPNHGMSSGDGPVRVVSTGTLPGGIGSNTDYWFIRVDKNYVKLAANRANALAGTPVVNLTSLGSGTIYTTESPGNGVAFTSASGTNLADQKNRQNNWEKYVGKTYTGLNGPYRACAMQPILPLTNDKSAILSKINALNAAGNTHIPIGLAWGWRLVSPDAPFTEGVAYNNKSFQKAIVLMTDGENTMPTENTTLNGSDYTAYGYAAQEKMGTGINTVSKMETEMGLSTGNNSLTRICDAIKAKDIRLYTIAVQINSTGTKNMLKSCATTTNSQQLYFDAKDNASLQAAFAAIATDLSNLRISH